MLTSTTSCRRNAAATSRRGSPRIPTMPRGCSRGARWRKRCMPGTIRLSTRRCRSGSISNGWYESASGERFTIYTAKSDAEATQMRYAAEGQESTLFWADDGVVYAVVSTGADRGRLTQIAQAVYDQMEKKS